VLTLIFCKSTLGAKARMMAMPGGEKHLMIHTIVLIPYHKVTDRDTDKQIHINMPTCNKIIVASKSSAQSILQYFFSLNTCKN